MIMAVFMDFQVWPQLFKGWIAQYPLDNSLAVDSIYSVEYSDCCISLCFQHKRTLEQLSSLAAEKEELSQRCHELDEQVMS